jgi:septum site-determining protein MinC
LTLESGAWPLHTGELRELFSILEPRGLTLIAVEGRRPSTLVAAAALGLPTAWSPDAPAETPAPLKGEGQPGLLVHRGTLRSGDHLQAEGSVLLLGDLNPGARISAGGHVLVWGRLRGVAHAGRRGDTSARIVALQLRPLQLRIAGAVARGPEDRPPEGLAEEARLEDGEIRIEPADPLWPLND